MLSPDSSRLTVAEYLERERRSESKSEFLDGEIFAMTGASRPHNLISANITGELRSQLKQRPCEVYVSDMRVKVSVTGLYTYPDVVVACGEPAFEDAEVDTLLNPVLIVEVLSKTTADYDRGGKFEHYRRLPSLREYLLVAQHQCHVMQYVRQSDNGWLLTEIRDIGGSLYLSSIDCHLLLAEIYAKVRFADQGATG